MEWRAAKRAEILVEEEAGELKQRQAQQSGRSSLGESSLLGPAEEEATGLRHQFVQGRRSRHEDLADNHHED